MDYGNDVYDEVEDVFDFFVSLFYCVSTLCLSLKEAMFNPDKLIGESVELLLWSWILVLPLGKSKNLSLLRSTRMVTLGLHISHACHVCQGFRILKPSCIVHSLCSLCCWRLITRRHRNEQAWITYMQHSEKLPTTIFKKRKHNWKHSTNIFRMTKCEISF